MVSSTGNSGERAIFVIDCSKPHRDNIVDPDGLRQFLHDKIKVDGKTGNFEKLDRKSKVVIKQVIVSGEGSLIRVNANLPFKKRYLKYLTKKYLAKQQIRDFLRVVATSPTTYSLKYFAAAKAAGEA